MRNREGVKHEILIPQERRCCKRCLKLFQRGARMPDYCSGCLRRNLWLWPKDHHKLMEIESFLSIHDTKERLGLKRLKPRRRFGRMAGPHSHSLATLTPEQRARYDDILSRSLFRAKLANKRTDGHHMQPYIMGALSAVLRPDVTCGGNDLVKKGFSRKMKRAFLNLIERERMLWEKGLIVLDTDPAVASKPRSVYNPVV